MKTIFKIAVMGMCIFVFSGYSLADQWINPRDYFGDPDAVRLSRDKKALTVIEKEEIATYGFTGLELMIYNFYNLLPGFHDRDSVWNFYNISPGGKILRTSLMDRNIYPIEKKDLLYSEKSPPGKVWRR